MTRVDGFAASGLLSDAEVVELLMSSFRQVYLDHLAAVLYIDTYHPTLVDQEPLEAVLRKGLYVASTHKIDSTNGVETVEVYRQDPSGNSDADEMRRSVVHEVAYSVFSHLPSVVRDRLQKILPPPAGTDRAVDAFCDAYTSFVFTPEQLRATDPAMFNVLLSIQ
jgi:hypothetical protein